MSDDSHKKIRVERNDNEPYMGTVNEIEAAERRRIFRIVAVVCALVFTTILSMVVGTGLALWDMGRSPSDLVAAISGEELSSSGDFEGLTFIDGNEPTNDDSNEGLTFIEADSEGESTGLTFIDPEENTDGDKNAEQVADIDGDGFAEDGNTSDGAQVGDVLDNGSIVVSSELSGIGSIIKAGSDETMSVTTLSQTSEVNPDSLYPLPFSAVDESYFEDALFIGDSRLQGFGMWSGMPGTYYCATGFQLYDYKTKKIVQTGNGKVPIFDAIPYNAFTKIYIKVGLNEMGWGTEAGFEEAYANLIADLRAVEPRAIIYVHAVLPVTAAKSASDKSHNNPNVIARNTALKQFALDQRAYFIDAAPAVSDENGNLRPETTSDGIHLSSKYMGLWKQFLLDNAVVVPESGMPQ